MDQQRILELIKQSKENNTQAFAALVSMFQGSVFRLSFRLLCDEEEAKDMVQEVFIKVWQSLRSYNSTYRFSTWLYKITSNACYDRLRHIQHRPEGQKSSVEISGLHILSSDNIESSLINEELKRLILEFTGNLTPMQKLVFILRDIEGLEAGEVETITGLSSAKIKSNLYLARKYIREQITKLN